MLSRSSSIISRKSCVGFCVRYVNDMSKITNKKPAAETESVNSGNRNPKNHKLIKKNKNKLTKIDMSLNTNKKPAVETESNMKSVETESDVETSSRTQCALEIRLTGRLLRVIEQIS